MGCALLLAAAGCSGGLSSRSVKPSRGEQAIPSGVTRVRIQSSMGSLQVDASPGPERTLRWVGECMRAAETPAALAELDAAPSVFQIGTDPDHPEVLVMRSPGLPPGADPLRSILGIEARIWLPRDLAVEVELTGSGHLTATDRAAPVRLTTERGDLRIVQCTGGAVLRTGAGMTIVDRHEGDLDVLAKVGDMQIWVRKPGDKVLLVTGSGTIQCHLPPDAGFELDGRTMQGKAGAGDFGIQAQAVKDFGRVLQGVHGDGHTSVVMRSGMGNLLLRSHTFE